MKRIFNYLKKHYKFVLPFLLLLILFIGFFTYQKINKYTTSKNDAFYMYLIGVKKDYDATLTFNRKSEITKMKINGETIEIDSTPIYYKNKSKVLFPKSMNLVFPLKGAKQYKTDSFTILTTKSDMFYLNSNKNESLENFFLYDGDNLYFFIDEVTLKINEEEITLPSMSYVIYNQNSSIEYYNKATDEYVIRDISDETVTVFNNYYKINVMNDSVYYAKNERLLIKQIDSLPNIKEL